MNTFWSNRALFEANAVTKASRSLTYSTSRLYTPIAVELRFCV